MKRSTQPWSARRRTKGAAAVLAAATAATVAGMGAAAPAQSATGSECPDAFPTEELAADQPVTGLTVTKGTVPGEFSGRVLGVMKDGIMPGLDMVLVRLGSDTTGVNKRIFDVGIWQGMSGSPVYAADGRLIGAVSYGLSYGPSTVAGVTPAAEMQRLLADGSVPAPRPVKQVDLPQRIENRVVASGAATSDQVDDGLSQLELPFGMAGLDQRRFKQVSKRLDIPGVRMVRMGTAGAGSLDAGSIVAGGNIAAAVSYGDVSFAGVGTATMVCGEDVVAFGHPMMWAGPTGLSMHPADAVYVQEDPAWAGFKVANIGGPVGTIDQDRMAGIAGFVGDLPDSGMVTSHVVSDTDERSGETTVNLPNWMPDVALSHLLSNEDRVFDGVGKGSGTMSYVVEGLREDGTPFSVSRSDVYADEGDLTWSTAWDLYMTLGRLEWNGREDVTISTVDTDSELTREYRHAVIDDVSIRQGGEWRSLSDTRRLALHAGRTAVFKVDLVTTGAGPSTLRIDLPVRAKHAGRRGWLEVTGGNSSWGGFGGRNLTIDKLIERIEAAPHNDDVIASMRLSRMRKSQHNVRVEQRIPTGVAVDGGVGLRLRILGGIRGVG